MHGMPQGPQGIVTHHLEGSARAHVPGNWRRAVVPDRHTFLTHTGLIRNSYFDATNGRVDFAAGISDFVESNSQDLQQSSLTAKLLCCDRSSIRLAPKSFRILSRYTRGVPCLSPQSGNRMFS